MAQTRRQVLIRHWQTLPQWVRMESVWPSCGIALVYWRQ